MVTFPQKRHITVSRALVLLACSWTLCLATNSPWLAWSRLQPIGGGHYLCVRSPPDDHASVTAFSVAVWVSNYFLPLVATWFAYVAVLYKMWSTHTKVLSNLKLDALLLLRNAIMHSSGDCVLIILCVGLLKVRVNISQ